MCLDMGKMWGKAFTGWLMPCTTPAALGLCRYQHTPHNSTTRQPYEMPCTARWSRMQCQVFLREYSAKNSKSSNVAKLRGRCVSVLTVRLRLPLVRSPAYQPPPHPPCLPRTHEMGSFTIVFAELRTRQKITPL
jgi:hypothetical protein